MRKRILTVKQKGKRLVVESQYCKVGDIYNKPIKTKKNDK